MVVWGLGYNFSGYHQIRSQVPYALDEKLNFDSCLGLGREWGRVVDTDVGWKIELPREHGKF